MCGAVAGFLFFDHCLGERAGYESVFFVGDGRCDVEGGVDTLELLDAFVAHLQQVFGVGEREHLMLHFGITFEELDGKIAR